MDNVLKPPSKQELQAKIQAEEEEIERLRLRLNELFDNGAGAIFDQISRLSRDIRLLGRPGSHEEKELYKKQAKLMENPLYVEARNCMRQRGTAQSRRFEYMKALNILKAREAPYISPLSKSLPAASTTLELPGNSTTESGSPGSSVSDHDSTSFRGWELRWFAGLVGIKKEKTI